MKRGDSMLDIEIGSILIGKVTGIEKYGIFVNIDNKYTGLIHISEVSDRYVSNLNNYAQIGEELRVRVIGKDKEKAQLKLSIKDLDYRINNKRKTKIEETEKGFETLREKLPVWIKEKLEEIDKNNDK